MKYRRLGRTGLEVSEIAFGGGRVGGIVIDPDADTKRRAVRVALDAGINWFDTARAYGNGKSETALGWLLAEVPEKPFLSTKVRIEPDEQGDIMGAVERALAGSLERLRRGAVDLFQLHNPVKRTAGGGRSLALDGVLRKGGALETMERMRDQGLTRFIGFSALGDPDCNVALAETGRFDTAQVYYNMINPSAARAMPPAWTGYDSQNLIAVCRKRDMGILAIRIYAAGYLATTERTGRESILTPNTEAASEERMADAVFAALGAEYGSRAQTALRFVLANPDISTAVVGAAEVSHVEDAVAAEEMGPLPPTALERLDRLYADGFKSQRTG